MKHFINLSLQSAEITFKWKKCYNGRRNLEIKVTLKATSSVGGDFQFCANFGLPSMQLLHEAGIKSLNVNINSTLTHSQCTTLAYQCSSANPPRSRQHKLLLAWERWNTQMDGNLWWGCTAEGFEVCFVHMKANALLKYASYVWGFTTILTYQLYRKKKLYNHVDLIAWSSIILIGMITRVWKIRSFLKAYVFQYDFAAQNKSPLNCEGNKRLGEGCYFYACFVGLPEVIWLTPKVLEMDCWTRQRLGLIQQGSMSRHVALKPPMGYITCQASLLLNPLFQVPPNWKHCKCAVACKTPSGFHKLPQGYSKRNTI